MKNITKYTARKGPVVNVWGLSQALAPYLVDKRGKAVSPNRISLVLSSLIPAPEGLPRSSNGRRVKKGENVRPLGKVLSILEQEFSLIKKPSRRIFAKTWNEIADIVCAFVQKPEKPKENYSISACDNLDQLVLDGLVESDAEVKGLQIVNDFNKGLKKVQDALYELMDEANKGVKSLPESERAAFGLMCQQSRAKFVSRIMRKR